MAAPSEVLATEYPDRVLPFHFRAPNGTEGSARLLEVGTSDLTVETTAAGAEGDTAATGAEEEAAEAVEAIIPVVKTFSECYDRLKPED